MTSRYYLTTYYSLLTTYYLLALLYLLLTTYYSVYSLLTTYYLRLLTTYYLPLTTYYLPYLHLPNIYPGIHLNQHLADPKVQQGGRLIYANILSPKRSTSMQIVAIGDGKSIYGYGQLNLCFTLQPGISARNYIYAISGGCMM